MWPFNDWTIRLDGISLPPSTKFWADLQSTHLVITYLEHVTVLVSGIKIFGQELLKI
jgi:hypothetical protein